MNLKSHSKLFELTVPVVRTDACLGSTYCANIVSANSDPWTHTLGTQGSARQHNLDLEQPATDSNGQCTEI